MPEAYSEVEIRVQQAVDEFYQREDVSIPALAREFNVPEQRLRARCNGRRSYLTKPGANRRLSLVQEKAICEYLDRLDSIGTAARHHMLKQCADTILAAHHPNETTAAPTVGPKWAQQFLNQHPEYSVRRQKTIDVNQKVAHDVDSIRDWFTRFHGIVKDKGVAAGDCYNMDETGFRIGIRRDQWILTKDSKRQSYLPSSSNRKSITVVEAISGDGTVLPPFIIMSGVLQQEIWFTQTNIDDDYMVAVSETGFSNDKLSYNWLKHFDRFSAACQSGVYRLFLLDSYGFYCTYEFVIYCDERKIIPFCMPPHATHLLQPLDVVVFQPYKHWHAEAVDEATWTGCHEFNKVKFLSALGSIRTRTFKRSSILSGF